jgi:hypothetical protein
MTKKLDWKDRVIAATHNGQSQFGCILLSALRRDTAKTLPRFGRNASVTSDGFVMCDFTRANGEFKPSAFVGTMADLDHNVLGLAKHLKLTTQEHGQLSEAISAWIAFETIPF